MVPRGLSRGQSPCCARLGTLWSGRRSRGRWPRGAGCAGSGRSGGSRTGSRPSALAPKRFRPLHQGGWNCRADLVSAARLDRGDVSQEAAKPIALELFREGTVGRAAELPGAPLASFMEFAAAHGVPPLNCGLEQLEEDRRPGQAPFVIVVSDSPPLITPARIGRPDRLPRLFPAITITPEVFGEVVVKGAGLSGASEIAAAQWIGVAPVNNAPRLTAADRGFHSADNVQRCQQDGIGEVCIPQRGGQKTAEQEALERSPQFKKGQRFRAGIEGRISVLFRGRGMKRCRAKGRERFEILVGAAVLANNLMRIAQLMEDQKAKRRRAAA